MSEGRLKAVIVGVWLLALTAVGSVVLHNEVGPSRPAQGTATPAATPVVQHPNIDGVAPGMSASDPAVKRLVDQRKPKHPPPAKVKDVTVEFQDGSTLYYNTYGQVGGLDGKALRDGDQDIVVKVGDAEADIEHRLGRPMHSLMSGEPKSNVFLLSPGLCTQIFLDPDDHVSRLNLYLVNPIPK